MKDTTLRHKLEEIMADETKVTKTINAAAGVIHKFDDNKRMSVLIIQRAADDHWPLHWEFPRGKCDKPPGENLIHCLKREIKEETGLDVRPIEKIDVHEYLADGGTRKTFCHNYLCTIDNPNQKVKLSKEHDSFKWISEIGEVELMVMPEQKKTLEKILNSERSIVSYPDDETDIQHIEEYLNYLEEAAGITILKAYFAAMIAKMAFNFYKENFSKLARRCAGFPGKEKTICMLQAKGNAKKLEVGKLKAGISKCAKAENPEKCKAALQNKLNQANAVMKLAFQRAKQLGTQQNQQD